MAENEREQGFGFLLHDISRLMRKRFDRQAHALGLTRAQWAVLAHLHRCEGATQAVLAELMELEPITLARLLDKLEAAGWVERRPHPTDRRAKQVFLQPEALPTLAELRRIAAEVRGETLAGLNPEERERLLSLLMHIKHNLSALEGSRNGLPQEAPDDARTGPPQSVEGS